MFNVVLPVEVFTIQAEFIRSMEANRDFMWWAEELIVEETGELLEAFNENQGLERVLSEMGDVIYVTAGFYNTMPAAAEQILSEAQKERLEAILTKAYNAVQKVASAMDIPVPAAVAAFKEIHKANMSKLDDDGNPIRSDGTDGNPVGKILKGPNWKPADMSAIVSGMDQFREEAKAIHEAQQALVESQNAEQTH